MTLGLGGGCLSGGMLPTDEQNGGSPVAEKAAGNQIGDGQILACRVREQSSTESSRAASVGAPRR